VISSVPFTTLWNGDAKRDSWAAFQEERASLLDIMSSVPNTFVLTGDRHEFAIVRHLGALFGEVLEVSTSPLSMFWLPIPSPWKVRKQSRRVVHRAEDGWAPEETLLEHVSMGNFKWSDTVVPTLVPIRANCTQVRNRGGHNRQFLSKVECRAIHSWQTETTVRNLRVIRFFSQHIAAEHTLVYL
jgi:hypothetical protein